MRQDCPRSLRFYFSSCSMLKRIVAWRRTLVCFDHANLIALTPMMTLTYAGTKGSQSSFFEEIVLKDDILHGCRESEWTDEKFPELLVPRNARTHAVELGLDDRELFVPLALLFDLDGPAVGYRNL